MCIWVASAGYPQWGAKHEGLPLVRRPATQVLARKEFHMTQALTLALEALCTCTEGDYSTGHVIHPSFDEKAVAAAQPVAEPSIIADDFERERLLDQTIEAVEQYGDERATEAYHGEYHCRKRPKVLLGEVKALLASLAAPPAAQPEPRQGLSNERIDALRMQALVAAIECNSGVIGGPDVTSMEWPVEFARSIESELAKAWGVKLEGGK